ncbi:MAG TPA: glycosyltransferase family 2 protein, partial [Longimicrobiales bacterium]
MHDVTPADVPRLSIIIVSWNVRDLLIACLESVMAQEDVQLEVFVVDNASADGTVEAVRERFPDVTVIANRENVGFPRANNQVLGYARGEYILYLNPDTEVQPGTLSACVAELDAHPELGAVGSRLQFADGQVQYDGARRAFRLRHLAYDM